MPEGGAAGNGKDASGLAGLPIPKVCLRADPVQEANGQSGPGWKSESIPIPGRLECWLAGQPGWGAGGTMESEIRRWIP
jgi:hypothetical protein